MPVQKEQRILRTHRPMQQSAPAQQRYIDESEEAEDEEEPANPHRAGHSSGIHPEDAPRTTNTGPRAIPLEQREPTTTKSRIPSVYVYDDNSNFHDDSNLLKAQSSVVRYQQPTRTVQRVQPAAVPARRTASYQGVAPVQQPRMRIAQEPIQQARRKPQRQKMHWLVYVGILSIALVAGGILIPMAQNYLTVMHDNWIYGNPRHSSETANLGYGSDSTINVQNDSGQIDLTETHGTGKDTKVKSYDVANLYGENADKYPPTIIFARSNGKITKVIIVVHDTQYPFTNNGKELTPIKMG